MALTAFISYSHSDEKACKRLEKHLAMMRRQGTLEAWYDHAILPGGHLDTEIIKQLENAELFLPLVSSNFLDSKYCYEKEFEHALKLVTEQKLRIVPIILEPCDWRASPLNQFKALPKDGKPISEWTNQNLAFLDIVTELRHLIEETSTTQGNTITSPAAKFSATRRVKVKRDFDSIERSNFADDTYQLIYDYFRRSCDELTGIDETLRSKFERISSKAFTCTVVNRAKIHGDEASITVHNQKGRRVLGGDITYTYDSHGNPNTANGFISVKADEYNLYLSVGLSLYVIDPDKKFSPETISEVLWKEFIKRAGIEYE